MTDLQEAEIHLAEAKRVHRLATEHLEVAQKRVESLTPKAEEATELEDAFIPQPKSDKKARR